MSHSSHPTIVEYAVQEMMKGVSPATAAKRTVEKLSGSTNLFVESGSVVLDLDQTQIENELYGRMAQAIMKALPRLKEGKEHYALSGVMSQFSQKSTTRRELKRRINLTMGKDMFPNDDGK